LLDSLTALGRAYTVSSVSASRTGHSGVDAAALYPAKKFFGAARNIENGGSLTVIASAVTETGSALDSAILNEFDDNANLEIRLSRTIADQRIFPAVDVRASGTRREDLLLGGDEVALTGKLRRGLAARGERAALDYVLGKLGDTPTNVEFLMQVQRDSSLDEMSGAGN
jgi:transcription termination factor Rho